MFHEVLTEFPIDFPPSYPFEEDTEKATVYMPTRCPAWCDRILLNFPVTNLINLKENVKYALLGVSKCMGDHKVSVKCAGKSYVPQIVKLDSNRYRKCSVFQLISFRT